MDKDKLQMNHHASLHHESTHEEASINVDSPAEHVALDKEADMDALEAKLFAMVKSRL
ncbi:MAG: hypothetical protein WCI39_05885 [Gallionellaceae bacterium]